MLENICFCSAHVWDVPVNIPIPITSSNIVVTGSYLFVLIIYDLSRMSVYM